MVAQLKKKRCNHQDAAWTLKAVALLIQNSLLLQNEHVHRCRKIKWEAGTGAGTRGLTTLLCVAGMSRKMVVSLIQYMKECCSEKLRLQTGIALQRGGAQRVM